jgi:O-acetyl-ADP-ribose deacetylase (regulator of RNase III)
MKLKQGNLIKEVHEGVIIHQVNAQGVMGSGFAKELRATYPDVWTVYSARLGPSYCQKNSGAEFMGEVIFAEVSENLVIANIVGQQFFGRDGKRYTSYDALDKGFAHLAKVFGKSDVYHHPAIGSGLGGANWRIVSTIIEEHLGPDTTLWLLS